MAIGLGLALEHGGKLERRSSGSWTYPDTPHVYDPRGVPDWIVLHATVAGLVDRGRMKFTTFKLSRGARHPITAEVIGEKE